MANIHSLRQAQVLTVVSWLQHVTDSSFEISSPVFSTKILDIQLQTSKQLNLFYQTDKGSVSSFVFMPRQTSYHLDLAANGLEIPGTARFFIVGNGEKFDEDDYIQISFIG